MSIKCVGRVWQHSQQKGSALLLLLAIADYAHDDGSGAWPAVETLAAKTRLQRRQIQRLLKQLEASGELKLERVRKNKTYDMTVLVEGDNLSPSLRRDGGNATPDVTSSRPAGHPQGDMHDTLRVTPMSPKPYLEPSVNHPSTVSSEEAALRAAASLTRGGNGGTTTERNGRGWIENGIEQRRKAKADAAAWLAARTES